MARRRLLVLPIVTFVHICCQNRYKPVMLYLVYLLLFISLTPTVSNVRSSANGASVIKEIRVKIWSLASRLSRSPKVIETDTDQSAAYDFLLTFHSSYGPISHRFGDKRRFQSKIFPPRIFWAVDTGALGQKTRIMGLSDREKSLTISSALWIQYTNVTDGQTDGGTPGDSKDRAYA